jgi:hypothetical protein
MLYYLEKGQGRLHRYQIHDYQMSEKYKRCTLIVFNWWHSILINVYKYLFLLT